MSTVAHAPLRAVPPLAMLIGITSSGPLEGASEGWPSLFFDCLYVAESGAANQRDREASKKEGGVVRAMVAGRSRVLPNLAAVPPLRPIHFLWLHRD